MTATSPIQRRRFLKQASVGASIVACPAIVRAQNLNSRLQIAGIGCDGKGFSDIREMDSHSQTQMVGFCDVDTSRMEKVQAFAPEAPKYSDYRELLEDLGDQVDAVTVSTPDHMHAAITVAALGAGKHVYCQKPLTHNVWESRQVAKAAKQAGTITRLGNQIHSHASYRSAVATIQSGAIGKVKRVHSWSSATGHGHSGYLSAPTNPPALPKGVDWDLWIGVAPMRPYGGERIYHPFGWRDWQDFGNGALGDFGCHIFDPVFTGIELNKAPLNLKSRHSGMNDQVWPAQTQVDYVFPGTKWTADPTIQITWYDGGLLPSKKDSHVPATVAIPKQGSIVIGETGSLVIPHYAQPILYPAEGQADAKLGRASVVERPSLNHYHGWVDGCLSGKQPSDGFGYGAKLTESVLLGNVAVRFPRKKLIWDEAEMRVSNLPEANRWLSRDYRDGWKISAV